MLHFLLMAKAASKSNRCDGDMAGGAALGLVISIGSLIALGILAMPIFFIVGGALMISRGDCETVVGAISNGAVGVILCTILPLTGIPFKILELFEVGGEPQKNDYYVFWTFNEEKYLAALDNYNSRKATYQKVKRIVTVITIAVILAVIAMTLLLILKWGTLIAGISAIVLGALSIALVVTLAILLFLNF